MAYMCQGCSAEGEVWPGECPNCRSKSCLTLAPKKKDLVGQVINGRYKVTEKLGQGGMGTVYKAIREDFGQTLAIKMLNPEYSNEPEVVRRFLREVKTYGAIQHQNAVGLVDSGQTEDGALFIAMEFIAGRDLGRTIGERGPLPVTDALDVCVQCCDVLGYAHEKGIIHRDLKPENIMLIRGLRSYHAKVLDFGIARLMDNTATQLTIQGTICGTPRYMSPEQARGRDIDNRSDIYSLGLVLFEMLTGRQAYTYPSITDLLRAQVTEPVPHLSETDAGRSLPEALDAVVQRACAKNRDERFISMGQFADALSKALPTLNELRPYAGDSQHALAHDAASPGRTFLGPGAVGGAPLPGSHASLTGPQQPASSQPRVVAEVTPGGATYTAIDAAKLAKSMTPAPILDAPTRLRASPAGRTDVERQRSPTSLPLASERPEPREQPRSRSGLFFGLGALAIAGIGAAFAAPHFSKPAEKPLEPIVSPPIAPQQPPPVAAREPTPAPAPTPAATQPMTTQPTSATQPAPAPNAAVLQQQAADAKLMLQATYQNAYTTAVGAFAQGNIDGAKQSLQLIQPDADIYKQASELKKKVEEAQAFLAKGRSAHAAGDCEAAAAAYARALKLSGGLGEARAGLKACKSAEVPDTAE